MVEVNPLKVISFQTASELSDWLRANHKCESELWVKIFKKNSGTSSITWNELVLEVLCWGWIDGIKKSLDEHSYLQRVTPRTSRSKWSKKNTQHVERLIKENRMQEAGLIQVQAAKADGRWDSAYTASEITIPLDFIEAIESNQKVKHFFETLNKTNRFVIAYGLTSAKKPETRQKRFTKYMAMLANKEIPK